ncbi:unnamed protein product [Rhizoctonia solani]|uniref:Uncharacterized protein n=1 Tax=Rhizoctonia solani TaxID=456999 RepID=A0A8H3CG06_9AGAM|nr:unnamed protein product [Rhizoctonia solani]
MASMIMNVIKEEVVASTSAAASVTPAAVSAGRSAVSHSVATSAPSASVRVTAGSGAELLGAAARSEVAHVARVETQSVLANQPLAAMKSPVRSSLLGGGTNSESGTLRSVLPELREQISQAAQQGFEELKGDRAPRLESSLGVAETIQQIEELVASR